jgi:hypothetical protein
MGNLVSKLADASIALVATGIAGMVWLNLRWLLSSKRTMELLLAESRLNGRSVKTLFRMQGSQLASLKASLEAQRDGECNGNVTHALESIEEAQGIYDEHLLSMLGRKEEKT